MDRLTREAVHGTDRSGEHVDSGSSNEFGRVRRVGERRARRSERGVLRAGDGSELGFHPHTDLVRLVDDRFRERDVVLEAEMRAVHHHRGESEGDAGSNLL